VAVRVDSGDVRLRKERRMPEIYEGNTGVYCIRNVKNGKRYVGSAAQGFMRRWKQHRKELLAKCHHSDHLQKAWNKYGSGAFVFQILERCPPKKCVERETIWIARLEATDPNKGYNICKTGRNALGVKRSERMKAKLKKNWEDPEYRRNKISKTQKTYQDKIAAESEEEKQVRLQTHKDQRRRLAADPEWRRRQAEGIKRRSANPEWQRRQVEAAKRRSANPEWRKNQIEGARRRMADPEWQKNQEKARAKLRGKPRPAEHVRKIGESLKRHYSTPKGRRDQADKAHLQIQNETAETRDKRIQAAREGIRRYWEKRRAEQGKQT
jgi:group I intron endonuclease